MKRSKPNMMNEGLGRLLYIVPKMPVFAQIETTNLCNLNCKMCPRHKLGIKYEEMSLERFKMIMDKLPTIVEVNLTGWGEPLCHSKLSELIRYCKEKEIIVDFTTNGILLDDKIQEKLIESRLDKISFSVDYIQPINGSDEWGHENSVQLKNISNFAKKKAHPEITLQTTMHKGRDYALLDVIEFAHEHKIHKVNLTRLDCRFIEGLQRPTLFEEKHMFKKAEKLGKKLGVQVDMIQYSQFTGIKKVLTRAVRPLLHQFDKFCPKPYNYIYITTEGFVTPCCLLTKAHMGNILEQNLEDIWNSEKFRNFQKDHRAVCRGCDLLKMKYSK